MRLEEIIITPALARKYLSHNTRNRKVKQEDVAKYASDMKNGKWETSPEPISFFEDGTLRDGQHRLLAIIKANTPIKVVVAFDVPNDSIICDRGIKRNDPDIFTMDGNVPELAHQVATGAITFLLKQSLRCPVGAISTTAKLEFAKNNYDILTMAAHICNAGGSGPRISRKAPIFAAIYCALFCGYDERVLERFATVLNTGHQSNESEDAAIVARNQIIFDYRGKTSGAFSQKDIFAIVLQAITDFQTCTPRKRRYPVTVVSPLWKRTSAAIAKAYAN